MKQKIYRIVFADGTFYSFKTEDKRDAMIQATAKQIETGGSKEITELRYFYTPSERKIHNTRYSPNQLKTPWRATVIPII